MSAILYGNLSVEVVSDLGTRIERTVLRTAATGLLASRPPAALPRPRMLGRERESADARRAIRAGQPIGLHATCGYGKTTLLQHIVASAADDGVAPNCIYLRADGDRIEDLLHDLVTRLYTSARPVKLTAHECALVLAEVSAVVAVDDFSAGPDRVGQLLDALPGCRLVIGSARPVIGRRGSSRDLAGLPDEAALALLAEDLGRPLTSEEIPAATRLTAAVDGQPLHLKQAAALVREGRHTFTSLASKAAGSPATLDRLSVDALAEYERHALAVLALAAGALLPADVVAAIADVADLTESLGSLRRRGLAEQRDDRFGLPVCKAATYREMLLKNLQLGSSARDLGAWLAARGPASRGSQSAADAALSIMDLAAELGDWAVVARLARAAESVLFLAGRWEAWHHVLGRGLEAATEAGDRAAEAFFSHQLGSLAFCQDQLDDAVRLLQHALALREQIGEGPALTSAATTSSLSSRPDLRRRFPRRPAPASAAALCSRWPAPPPRSSWWQARWRSPPSSMAAVLARPDTDRPARRQCRTRPLAQSPPPQAPASPQAPARIPHVHRVRQARAHRVQAQAQTQRYLCLTSSATLCRPQAANSRAPASVSGRRHRSARTGPPAMWSSPLTRGRAAR